MNAKFGRTTRFQCDLIPKFILAGGRLVKMLIQTGVTKYIEFAAVDKSFVYTSGKIYKVPVTPAEAIRTSLVGFFQKTPPSFVCHVFKQIRKPRGTNCVKQ